MNKAKQPSPEIPEVKVGETIIIAAARAALAKERQQRAIECGKEINAILKKYNCDLVAIPMINKEGKIVAQSQVMAKE
jgi:hypothetical protein